MAALPVVIPVWLSLLLSLSVALSVALPVALSASPSVAFGSASPDGIAAPPAALVRLDNPSRSAILRHEVRAVLDPASGGLAAEDRITILHAPGIPLSEPFPFLLWKDLEVRTAESDGRSVEIEPLERMNPRDFWRRPPYAELEGYENAREVRLRLSDAGSGTGGDAAAFWPETLTVTLRYSGTVLDSLRPPQAAYARSFETTAGLIEERGAFLAGSSFWIPSRPEEVFTFRCEAVVPEDWRAVSQGALVASSRPSTGGQSDVWDCPHPMEEIYLVAGPWTLHERDHGGVAVQTFTYANTDSALYTRYLDGTGDYLDLYGGLIGPYPFAKFALVENFWQTGFGMPSFTLLGDRVIRLPFILGTSYGHEILHNWWGNGVFVDYLSGNWCEGLTVYGADYLYKTRESDQAAREYRMNALASYLDYVSEEEDIPLSEFRSRHDFSTQAVGYSKSMMVIHQLHRRAGEERFWDALGRFYRDNLWRRASWDDLLASFEGVGSLDPAAFRAQWVERSGAPRIEVSEVSVRPQGSGWEVRATLSQEAPGAVPYDLLVPVRLVFDAAEAGPAAAAAAPDTTFQVPLREARLAWSATVPRRPARLDVDADFELMRRIHRSEIPATLSQVLGADTVTIVIAAGLQEPMETAWLDLAREWASGQAATIVRESEQPAGWTPSTSAWFLGLGPAARDLVAGLPEVKARGEEAGAAPKPDLARGAAPPAPLDDHPGGGWRIGGAEYPGTSNLVVAGTHEANPKLAWAAIHSGSPEDIAVLGRKVPHYGKYSFLVFSGGENIGKGVWSETDSPLRVDLGGQK